jgi:hypothetical protein
MTNPLYDQRMNKNTILKSLHKNINQAASNGLLEFLDDYQTQKIRGYFNRDKILFKLDALYSLKEINKDYSFLNKRLSEELIPIAKSENGDRLAIHFKSGSIYLWELSKDLLTDLPQRKETKIASSWSEFQSSVKSIIPETAQSISSVGHPKSSFFEKLFRAS